MENKPTFRLGICMAGAVSAGAYTAGVIDYLLEALDNWEHAKRLQEENKLEGIPKHNVSIEVLSGASAGGMTAAVTAAAIQNPVVPMNKEERSKPSANKKNPLYNAWVNLTENDEKDMMDYMLQTDDIENNEGNPNKEVRAGFNSKFITDIAEDVLTKTVKDPRCERSYIAKDIDIFTTITNLRGFHYEITFTTSQGIREHRMMMHRDIAFFQLNDTGVDKQNGRIPLSFVGEGGWNKTTLAQAAMATGAFPVGLESRELLRQREHILNNKYLNLHLTASGTQNVTYKFLPDGNFESLNVDGGVINNEPFEITQLLLDDRRKIEIREQVFRQATAAGKNEKEAAEAAETAADQYSLKTEARHFDTTVIMVDPFPNDDDSVSDTFTPLKAWKFTLPKIITAMRGQLMMKDSEIRKAYLSEDYTRFLIAPVRTKNNEKQKYSIACGAFGGFGGFFSKKFREHDFYLGRRNCQQFIQRHFSAPVSANNPILAYGYDRFESQFSYKVAEEAYLPIIPDIRVQFNEQTRTYSWARPDQETEPSYPSISLKYLLRLEKKLKTRIGCILSNVTNGIDPEKQRAAANPLLQRLRKKKVLKEVIAKVFTTPLTKLYLSIGRYASKGLLAKMFIDAVIQDMYERKLLDDDVWGNKQEFKDNTERLEDAVNPV